MNFLLPLQRIHFENVAIPNITATALLFSPIFLANLIYSALFRVTKQANVAFGANLLGTMVGGAMEYLALLTGYHHLVILAGVSYLPTFYSAERGMASLPSRIS